MLGIKVLLQIGLHARAARAKINGGRVTEKIDETRYEPRSTGPPPVSVKFQSERITLGTTMDKTAWSTVILQPTFWQWLKVLALSQVGAYILLG
jgi:hypothetical protein